MNRIETVAWLCFLLAATMGGFALAWFDAPAPKPAPVIVKGVVCPDCTKAGAYQPCSLKPCLRCDETCCKQSADRCCCLHVDECACEPAPPPPEDPTVAEVTR